MPKALPRVWAHTSHRSFRSWLGELSPIYWARCMWEIFMLALLGTCRLFKHKYNGTLRWNWNTYEYILLRPSSNANSCLEPDQHDRFRKGDADTKPWLTFCLGHSRSGILFRQSVLLWGCHSRHSSHSIPLPGILIFRKIQTWCSFLLIYSTHPGFLCTLLWQVL